MPESDGVAWVVVQVDSGGPVTVTIEEILDERRILQETVETKTVISYSVVGGKRYKHHFEFETEGAVTVKFAKTK